jgi:hypothetical protein
LSDACPPTSGDSFTSLLAGRHPTTLNKSGSMFL